MGGNPVSCETDYANQVGVFSTSCGTLACGGCTDVGGGCEIQAGTTVFDLGTQPRTFQGGSIVFAAPATSGPATRTYNSTTATFQSLP